jgi:hypothetical protein
MTEAQKAAYRLYNAMPGERITTHRQKSLWEQRRPRQRVHWNQKKFWGKRGG